MTPGWDTSRRWDATDRPNTDRPNAGKEPNASAGRLAQVRRSRPSIVLALLAPGVMLALDPQGWSPFTPAKWLAVSTLVVVGAAVALGQRPLRLNRAALVAWCCFLGWAALAAAFGNDRLYAWIGTPERHFGWVTWVLCALAFHSGQTMRRATDVIVVFTGIAIAGVGVGAYSAVEWVWQAPVRLEAVTDRVGGPFGSAAYLGAACVIVVPVLSGVAVEAELPRWLRTLATIGALASAVALVGSGTRGAWLAVIASAIIVAAVRAGWRRALLALVAAAVVVGTLAALPNVRSVASRQGAAQGAARLDEWRVATRIVGRHPLLGTGPEGYRIAFPVAVDAAYERAHGRAELPDRAHSVVLDVTATLGLPGLLLYGALLAIVARPLWRALRRGPRWRAGIAVALLAYGGQQLVLFPIAELEPIAWLLAGIVVAWEARSDELLAAVVPTRARLALAAIGIALALAGVLDVAADRAARIALRTHIDPNRAAHLRPDALRYRLVAARSAATPAAALDALHAARRLSPGDPIARIELARLVTTPAAWRDVIAHDPVNASAWLQRGVASANAGDLADAEVSWRRAEDLAPRASAPLVNLSGLYLDQGRVTEAIAAAGRAVQRVPGDAAAIAALQAAKDRAR